MRLFALAGVWVLIGLLPIKAQSVDDTLHLIEIEISDTVNVGHEGIQRIDSMRHQANQDDELSEAIQLGTTAFVRSNGPGTSSGLSVRGGSANQSKVFWNGLPMNNPMLGQQDLSLLGVDMFDRISLETGVNSVSYGAGGLSSSLVLGQMVSKWNEESIGLKASGGSFGFHQFGGALRRGNGRFHLALNVRYTSSDNAFTYTDYLNNDALSERQHAGFNNLHLQGRLSFRISEKHQLHLSVWNMRYDREIPVAIGTSQQLQKQRDQWLKSMLEWKWKQRTWKVGAKIGAFSDLLDYTNDLHGTESESEMTTMLGLVEVEKYLGSKMKAYTKLNAENQHVITNNYPEAKERLIMGGILGHQLLLKHLETDVAIRVETVGSFQLFLPKLRIQSGPFNRIRWINVLAGYAQNARIPSMNEWYWQNLGNPDLIPEYSETYEAGLRFQWPSSGPFRSDLTSTVFTSEIRDMIVWTPSLDGVWRPENISQVENTGVELILNGRWHCQHWRIDWALNYALVHSIDRSEKLDLEDQNKQRIYIPAHKWGGLLSLNYHDYFVTYSQYGNSRIYTRPDHSEYLPQAEPANVTIGKRFSIRSMSLKAGFSIRNIWNQDYQYALHMPMPLRNYMITLSFNYDR